MMYMIYNKNIYIIN